MAIESAADRAIFLDAAEFGVTVSYQAALGGLPVAIAGIFDNQWAAADGGGEGPLGVLQPTFLCRTEDLAALPGGEAQFGDTLSVNGALYAVRVIEPDGTGMTMLILEKQ